ncbi:MAG: DUF6044 family protein [Bacillota bacterium]|nr:DUF6044 family protein [Bacillota bacterium]
MLEKWKKMKQEKKHLIIAWIVLFFYLSPMFILGENSHIRVHDNLDSNISWYKVLKDTGQLFAPLDSTLPQIINGLPRNAFGTEFSGIQWLHEIFPSMLAYSISQAIVRIFAFLGMYLLLKRHFIKVEDAYPIRVWVALAFALTPFWPSGMLSTLGMPLALWAFLTIREGKGTWKEWLTLLLLPFYSSFVLGFFFFLTAMGLLWIRDVIVTRKWNWGFIGSIVFMIGMYLAIEYRLVYSLVFPEAPTNRNEFHESNNGFWATIRLAIKNYFFAHSHVLTMHVYIIAPLTFIVLWMIYKAGSLKKEKRFVNLFTLNLVLSFWYAFWFYKGWTPIKEKVSLLNTFNFARFHFLRPIVIYLLFATGSLILWKLGRKWKVLVKVCLLLQIVVLFFGNPEVYYSYVHTPSFKEFYAVKQFDDIKNYIGKPQSSYRVASIGLHPAIAQYNGFYTLDTYNNYYPLAYKHEFRKIIAGELDKSSMLKKYFDDWGGRCYIFVNELGENYDFKKDSKKTIQHLTLNIAQFKKMGGQYILSSVPILNSEETGLHFLRSFNNKESAWKIYLYQAE